MSKTAFHIHTHNIIHDVSDIWFRGQYYDLSNTYQLKDFLEQIFKAGIAKGKLEVRQALDIEEESQDA